MKQERNCVVYNHSCAETCIYFDPKLVALEEEDFTAIGKKIYLESGGRMVLVTGMAEYGMLSLQTNLAIMPDLALGLDEDGAVKKILDLIDNATAIVS